MPLSSISLLILAIMCFNLSATAQTSFNNNESRSQSAYVYTQLKAYRHFLDSAAKSNAETINKEIRDDYKELIRDKNNDLLNELEEKKFLFDESINPYLTGLFFAIVHANNLDNYPFRFFVSRSSAANAYSFDDCTIVCNLGLLNVTDNESELVMVLCHELGHYLLKHAYQSLTGSLEKYNSAEFRDKVKGIKKEKYNTRNKLEDLLQEDVFNRRRHNRRQEIAADSLGMLLFLRTGYNSAAIPALYDRLAKSDEIIHTTSIRFFLAKEKLNSEEEWFDTGKRISFGETVSKEIADSLKTHPDCSFRKQYAINFLNNHNGNTQNLIPSNPEQLAKIKKNALLEQCYYAKDRKNMSLYLFLLIQADALFAKDKFIINEIFDTLLALSIAQKNHTLFSVTDKPYATEGNKDEYANLLKMLERIELSQLAGITITYYQNNQDTISLTSETGTSLEKIRRF